MTYMTRACDLSATRQYASNKEINMDKLCIDFLTISVIMISFAVILMVALFYWVIKVMSF